MKKRQWILIALMMLLMGAGEWVRAESVSTLLEEGIYKEQTVGDLDGAMAIYRRIVEDAQANRSIVAQAMYRLGMCHLKKGQKEQSVELFSTLVTQYPEQTDFVQQVKKYLPTTEKLIIERLNRNEMEFPEVVNCRMKVRVPLAGDSEENNRSKPEPKRVFQGDILEFHWQVDPEKTTGIRHFDIFIYPAGADMSDENNALWARKGISASERSVTFEGKKESLRQQGRSKQLAVGEYDVRVIAEVGEQSQKIAATRLMVEEHPLTQIAINDIQDNIQIAFEIIMHVRNTTEDTWASTKYFNTDFVHIREMFDSQGRALAFDATHEGNIYLYQVNLNEPVLPGEVMLIGSRGHVSGLATRVPGTTDEFEYRMTHNPAAPVQTRRVEIYRLPKGAELLSVIPEELHYRQKDGRIELAHQKMVPPRGSITTAFRFRLPDMKR